MCQRLKLRRNSERRRWLLRLPSPESFVAALRSERSSIIPRNHSLRPAGRQHYKRSHLDLWPESHDARSYAGGPYPVVAHPPCNRWCCSLSRLVESQHPNDPQYAVGADGGTFASALAAVRRGGGVLEHPACTYSWAAHGLQRPSTKGGWLKTGEREWVCQVSQAAYGHRACKLTCLLYVDATAPPELDWSVPPTTAWVSCVGKGVKLPPSSRTLEARGQRNAA